MKIFSTSLCVIFLVFSTNSFTVGLQSLRNQDPVKSMWIDFPPHPPKVPHLFSKANVTSGIDNVLSLLLELDGVLSMFKTTP